MKLFFLEALAGCNCCCHYNHYRGPYESWEVAERRRVRLSAGTEKVREFHKGKFWVVEKEVERTFRFGGMEIWIIDGKWFYDMPMIDVGPNGEIDSDVTEHFCQHYEFV